MKSVNVYFADGDFKLLECELIREQYADAGTHCLFTHSESLLQLCREGNWDSQQLLQWRFKKNIRKYIGIRQRILDNLNAVASVCDGADVITLHLNVIFSERLNYYIRYLQSCFPKATLRVRLLFDGTVNLNRRPMHGMRLLPQYFNQLKWCWEPRINYYRYRGDRLGADADIVDRIYGPEGFPHEYPQQKFQPLRFAKGANTTSTSRRALVLGTPVSRIRNLTKSDEQLIGDIIEREIIAGGFEHVTYKPHPEELTHGLCLCRHDYEVLATERCAERLLTEQAYTTVFGNFTTALATAKLCAPQTRVVTCGLDVVERKAPTSTSSYRKMCEKLDIEVIDAAPARHSSSRRAA